MERLLNTWQVLTLQKKIIAVGAVVATLALVLWLARTAAEPEMSLLYGGLDAQHAGEVVAALDQLGVENEVRGSAVYVPAGERDRVRLSLAAEGLPRQNQSGYELLDQLSGFGTTSEMFQAAYWRAKEGELSRTITSVPGVASARVHIAAAARRPFSRREERATAAVHVASSGGRLSEQTALSIRYLVALAVPDLDPAQVAVIDAQGGVILKPGEESASTTGLNAAEERAERLRQELQNLLGVRFGEEAVRISVAVETTHETQTISEQIIDPDSQVTVASETEEITDNSTQPSQAVTVASNLPDGDAAAGQGGESNRTESRETISFQYSQTRRDQIVEAGAIKRLGVAVLVDHQAVQAQDGAISYTPRSAQELSQIEELVKSAVAFDSERGDTVTVESMRFAPMIESEPLEGPGMFDRFLSDNLGSVLQMAILGVVAIILGLFVVRPILTSEADPADEMADALADVETAAFGAADEPAAGLEAPDGAAAPAPLEPDAEARAAGGVVAAAGGEPVTLETPEEAKIALLRTIIGAQPEQAKTLLQRWLSGEAEPGKAEA